MVHPSTNQHTTTAAWLPMLFLLALAGFCVWELCVSDAFLPRPINGCILFVIGLLTGIRMGHDFRARFTGEAIRKNRYLAEQNRDLVESNHELLKTLLAQGTRDGESPDKH